jgi:hypothetical protein
MAKLTELNRQWIISRWKTGRYTQKYLATASGITQQGVNYILKREGLIEPKSSEGKCLACGEKLRHWHNYEICGDKLCGEAYTEAAQCKPQDPYIKYVLIQNNFWGEVPTWSEAHFKNSHFDRQIKGYSLFNSKREHVGYHWEIIKYGTLEFSKKTGSRIARPTNMKPIWDGVDNEGGERKAYGPALQVGP